MIFQGLRSAYSHCPDRWWGAVRPLGREALIEFESWCWRVEREFPHPHQAEKAEWLADVVRSLRPYQNRAWGRVALSLLAQKYRTPKKQLQAILEGVTA